LRNKAMPPIKDTRSLQVHLGPQPVVLWLAQVINVSELVNGGLAGKEPRARRIVEENGMTTAIERDSK
jgi:hypothetical protein